MTVALRPAILVRSGPTAARTAPRHLSGPIPFTRHAHTYTYARGHAMLSDNQGAQTCGFYVTVYGMNCASLEAEYACDCTGCPSCDNELDVSSPCPSTCYGKNCDEWYLQDGSSCSFNEYEFQCDCSGCSCTFDNSASGLCPETCTNAVDHSYTSCDHFVDEHGATCRELESEFGW